MLIQRKNKVLNIKLIIFIINFDKKIFKRSINEKIIKDMKIEVCYFTSIKVCNNVNKNTNIYTYTYVNIYTCIKVNKKISSYKDKNIFIQNNIIIDRANYLYI